MDSSLWEGGINDSLSPELMLEQGTGPSQEQAPGFEATCDHRRRWMRNPQEITTEQSLYFLTAVKVAH